MVSLKLTSCFGIVVLCSIFGIVFGGVPKETILDRVNIDTYLRNERAVKQQIKCILKNGPCDSVGKEMKRLMPMMVEDSNICGECTPTQHEKIQKIINHLKTNYPAEWAEGVKKYGVVGV